MDNEQEIEEFEDDVIQLRSSILTLLHMNFALLISQCKSCIEIQSKIDKIIGSDEKLQRDLMFLLNSLQTRISETVDSILPLMKKDDLPLLLEKRLKNNNNENYEIQDPEKKKSIEELKTYIKNILDKEKTETEKPEDELTEMIKEMIREDKKKIFENDEWFVDYNIFSCIGGDYMEIENDWKPIPNLEHYIVNKKLGQVKRIARTATYKKAPKYYIWRNEFDFCSWK